MVITVLSTVVSTMLAKTNGNKKEVMNKKPFQQSTIDSANREGKLQLIQLFILANTVDFRNSWTTRKPVCCVRV